MIRFTLRQLEVFARIARTGRVSAAAEELGMSQSAASAALAELERRSNRPLFDRIGKRLSLNEIGRALLPGVLETLDRAEELNAILAGAEGAAALKLGATVTIGNFLAPALISRYIDRFPGSSIALSVGNTDQIVAQLINFDLDLALIEGEYASPQIEAIDWREDMLTVFAGPDHPLAGKGPIDIDRLLEESWVVRESGSGTRQALERAMAAWLPRWRIAIELPHFDAIKNFVRLGDSLGCISRLALGQDLASGRLVEIPTPDLNLRRHFYIVVNRQKYRSDAIRAFTEICRS